MLKQTFVIALAAALLVAGPAAAAPPAAPTGVTASVASGSNQVIVQWGAMNGLAARYQLHRDTAPLFVPSAATRVRSCAATPCMDELSEPGTYYYRVIAEGIDGAAGPASAAASASAAFDPAGRPDIALSMPATISGTASVALSGGDPDGIAEVTLRVDGRELPQRAVTLPATLELDTTVLGDGEHTITAVATDRRSFIRSASRAVVVDNPRSAGLVGAYGFDFAPSGNLIFDSAGNKHGTNVGATWTESGRHGGGMSFNGTSGRIDLPALGTFYKAGFTLEAWVRPAAGVRDAGIVGSWSSADAGGAMLWVDHLSSSYTQTLGSNFRDHYLKSGKAATAGEWIHLTSTYDGERARFFLNGVLAAEKIFLGNVGNTNVWRIGTYLTSAVSPFKGEIDEVRIYRRPLGDAEVAADAADPIRAQPTVAPATPVLQGAGEVREARLTWSASSDATSYELQRSTTPSGPWGIVTSTGDTAFTDKALAGGTYHYRVAARNAVGRSDWSNTVQVDVAADTTPPSVSISEPADGATVSRTVQVTAIAADAIGMQGVRFFVDDEPLGTLDTVLPYRVSWDSTSVPNGAHTIYAVARDVAGNERTAAVHVTVANTVPGPGRPPIAHYTFDDGTGTSATDSSASARHGSLRNGATWGAGKSGGALSLDGVDDYVQLPGLGTFYRSGYTLEAWIKKRTNAGDVGIAGSWFSYHSNIGGGAMLWIDHVNARPTLVQGQGSTGAYVDSGRGVQPGVWQHVAATFDGARAYVYIDGEQVASGPAPAEMGTSNSWQIGSYGLNAAHNFDGLIDDVRIYDRALSGAEVRADMEGNPEPDDTVPPTTPGAFAVTASSATTVATSWTASTDADTAVGGYALYRDGVEVGQTTGTSFVFANLTCGRQYELAVEARDINGNPSTRAKLTAATPACQGIEGLMAAYSFDEGSGGAIHDSSGNGRTGTLGGAYSTGRTGMALNGYVVLPSLGTFYRQGFTLEAWVQPNAGALEGDQGIVGSWHHASDQGGGPMLWVDHVNARYHLTLNRGLENYLDSLRAPVADSWQHLAATYDGTTARFYVNGVEVAGRPFTGDVGMSDVWRIGAYGPTSTGRFRGLIDDVRIYSRPLSGDEVRDDMETPVGAGAA